MSLIVRNTYSCYWTGSDGRDTLAGGFGDDIISGDGGDDVRI